MAESRTVGPAPVEIPDERNLTDMLWERADADDHTQIFSFHDGRAWRSLTWGQLTDRVERVAAGLIASGIEPGDRVVLLSGTRLEWALADLAVLAAGAVTVPIYETSSADQCAWILEDSGAVLGFAATPELASVLEGAKSERTALGELVVFDEDGLDVLAERGLEVDRDTVRERARKRGGQDLFSLIYTSGTTGLPKGCELTHANMLWTAEQSGVVLRSALGEEDSTLLFLPLAHVFARLVLYLFLVANVPLAFSRGADRLIEDLPEAKPTFLLAVPRVFDKIFNGSRRKATGLKRKIFDAAVQNAYQWSEAVDAGRSPSLAVSLKHGFFDKLVYRKLRDAMGGRVKYCISGGAPLAPHLAHFFHAAGITVLEGYGLTETTAPATVNPPEAPKIGTVGSPLGGVEVVVAEDGEVLIRGGNVFRGYFNNPEATAEVLGDDGWLHTGDVGEIDGDGYLRITGRKKEIIVTAGGKNVAPAVLEERAKSFPLISQVMVIGDDRPFVAALVTLDEEALAAFAAEHGIEDEGEDLRRHPEVRAEVEHAIEHANAAVSRAESVRSFEILDRDFTEERGELTPTLKVRRARVAEHHADAIERLYQSD